MFFKKKQNTKNKICIISSVHTPFDTRIFHKESKSLIKAGYEVALIVQHHKDENIEGINVISIPNANTRIMRMTRTVWTAYQKAVNIDAFIYHFHDPELIPIGLLFKFLGYKVVYDIHEDVPQQILSKHWLPVILRRPTACFVGALEWIASKFFDAIVTATPTIAKRFPPNKTITVQNFPILGELHTQNTLPYLKRPAAFAYVGGITGIRGAKEMIQAISLLADRLDCKLELAGLFRSCQFQDELQEMAGWSKVQYHGQASRQEVANILGRVRAGLVLFYPMANHIAAQPNKMFEYMAAGLPIIASDFPLWRKIISASNCGILVDPLNPKAIANAMQWILENPEEAKAMGHRGNKIVKDIYNWEPEATKLTGLYKTLFAKNQRTVEV